MGIIAEHQVDLILSSIEVVEQALGIQHTAGSCDGNKYSQRQIWFALTRTKIGPWTATGQAGFSVREAIENSGSTRLAWEGRKLYHLKRREKQLESGAGFPRMARVLSLSKGALSFVILFLAGCASTPHRNLDHVADWQDLDTTPVAPEPAIPVTPPVPTNHLQASGPLTKPDETDPQERFYQSWIPLQEWTHARGLSTPTRLSVGPPVSYAVRSTNGVIVLSVGSVVAHWDGLEFRLGFAPQLINGQF